MELCDQRALAALRWYWRSAYLIAHPEHDVWIAVRRDDRQTLCNTTPLGLRENIIADYFARPVPRRLRGR